MATIEVIIAACSGVYRDTGQKHAMVRWIDSREKIGSTSGNPDSTHMKALLSRAKREHIKIRKSTYC